MINLDTVMYIRFPTRIPWSVQHASSLSFESRGFDAPRRADGHELGCGLTPVPLVELGHGRAPRDRHGTGNELATSF